MGLIRGLSLISPKNLSYQVVVSNKSWDDDFLIRSARPNLLWAGLTTHALFRLCLDMPPNLEPTRRYVAYIMMSTIIFKWKKDEYDKFWIFTKISNMKFVWQIAWMIYTLSPSFSFMRSMSTWTLGLNFYYQIWTQTGWLDLTPWQGTHDREDPLIPEKPAQCVWEI